jgi:hypothetical protein
MAERVREFMTYETNEGGADFLIVCMAERVRERNSKSRTTAKPSPPIAVSLLTA